MHYIVSYNILFKTNGFLIAKKKVILPLLKSINKKKSLYIDIFNKKDLILNKSNLASIEKSRKNVRQE